MANKVVSLNTTTGNLPADVETRVTALAVAAVTAAAKAPAARLITAGTGLSGGGDLTADRTLAVSLGTVGATLGSDVALPAATLTTVLSITLPAAGTYDLRGYVTGLAGAAASTVDLKLELGTATGTFVGATSASIRCPASTQSQGSVGALLTATAAGTVLLRCYGSAAATAKALSANGYAGACGLTAVRVA